MEEYEIKLIESGITLLAIFLCFKIVQSVIRKFGRKYNYHSTRVKIIKKIFLFVSIVISVFIVAFIWGIKASQLVAYIASLFTILAIAFVAQWSLLSNITATLIIFFTQQVYIGDRIQIMDKEFNIEGEIYDIGIFFTVIKVAENEYISLPSNVFIQKMVRKIEKAKD